MLTFRISHLKDFKMQLVLKIVKQISSDFVISLQNDLLYFPLMIICSGSTWAIPTAKQPSTQPSLQPQQSTWNRFSRRLATRSLSQLWFNHNRSKLIPQCNRSRSWLYKVQRTSPLQKTPRLSRLTCCPSTYNQLYKLRRPFRALTSRMRRRTLWDPCGGHLQRRPPCIGLPLGQSVRLSAPEHWEAGHLTLVGLQQFK